MRSFDVSVPCGQSAGTALWGVVKYLTQQGYAILDHKRAQALLVFSLGHPGAQRLDDERHNLEIKVTAEALAFRFYTSERDPHTHVPTQERNNLRVRAQHAVKSAAPPDGKHKPKAKSAAKDKQKAKKAEVERPKRTFEVSVPTKQPAIQALASAIAQLGALGYNLVAEERTRAVLQFGNAMDTGSRFDKRPHDVEVVADAADLHLRFFTDHDDPNEIVTKREREALTERAQFAARPVAPPAKPARPAKASPASADDFRCRYCKHMTALSLPQCRQCGADNFL